MGKNQSKGQQGDSFTIQDFSKMANLENLTLVWCDNSSNGGSQSYERQVQEIGLRRAINFLRKFTQVDECQAFIKEVDKETIILIVTGVDLAEKLLSVVHDLESLTDIYVIVSSVKSAATAKLAHKYAKIKSLVSNIDELISLLMATQTKFVTDDAISISVFTPERSTKDLSSENGDFLHLQILLEILLRMGPDDVRSSLNEFADLAYQQYQGNSDKLAEIDNLKATYTSEQAVLWYTRESPSLYLMLNKALRQQNIDLLFTFRFLIHDLSRQLTELKQEQYMITELLQLYRGQIMSTNELNQLRATVGNIISMNSFLSTSTNREKACQFVINKKINEEGQVRVLFEIVADTHRPDTRPFANISKLSDYPNEEEVLFMAGSVFRLVDILDEEEKGTQMHILKLRLCGDSDNQLRDVFTSMKNEIGQETNLLSFGNILREMGEFNRAAHFYRCLLAQLPTDSFNVAVCYYSLGSIAHIQGEYDEALRNYQHLLKQLPCSAHLITYQPDFVGLVYNAIGAAYESKDELNNAVKYYQQALDLLDQNNSLDAAAALGNLGNVYRKQNKFDLALATQQTCLQIYSRLLPDGHPATASTFENIAQVYLSQEEYDQALVWLQGALTMQLACLPANHPELADTYFDFGRAYESTCKLDEAADYYMRALKIRETSLPMDHVDKVKTEKCLQRVNDHLAKKRSTHTT